ncbi:unnamed protein product [Lactuca virosa]|uniref:C2H2-type domain-containing protein n=1 Tax=Lactuca virosa TaxID=75947 RepID=A0AAU9MK50_9ASTR|nr:unnamed protein product [Lactuca virosa]
MSGEQQQLDITSSFSTPNPNSPHADASISMYEDSHGFDGLGARPAFELDRAAGPQSGMIPQTTDSTTYEHHVANDAIVTTRSQPKSIQSMQCEVCNVTCDTKDVLEKHKQGKKHLKNMQKLAISSVISPKMPPPTPTPTPTASETSVGELENNKHKLLQNGASVDKLLYCETCNAVCNNQNAFQAHLAGKKHSAKAMMQLVVTNGVVNTTSESDPKGPTPEPEAQTNNNPNPIQCQLCKISCSSIEVFNTHMSGKKHLKKLKESGQIPDPSLTLINSQQGKPVWCELCGISCDTYDVFKTHLSGKKHKKNLEKSEKPVEGGGMLRNEEGKVVNVDGNGNGSNRKTKRVGGDEDMEAKRQKILQGGGALDALRICTVCNVVCSSPTVYDSHVAGRKHAANAMLVKQAETDQI